MQLLFGLGEIGVCVHVACGNIDLYFNSIWRNILRFFKGSETCLSTVQYCLFCAILLFSISSSVFAAELNGTVVKTTGKTVDIQLEGDLIPQKGDAVTISFDVPGVGPIPLKGTWHVSKIGKRIITAEPDGDTAQPKKDQNATIQCENPQSLDSLLKKAKALNIKGNDYYYGRNGVEKDFKRAVLYYRKSAEMGDAHAQSNIGYMYNAGAGVEKNYKQAVFWLRKAAEQQDAEAQYNLGRMYKNGRGVTKDLVAAIELNTKAAEQGYVKAQYSLGFMNQHGEGKPKDYAAALEWYGKAADQGNAKAQSNLGAMYFKGQGVVKNYKTARSWFQKAADKGLDVAQSNLGLIYNKGLGVPKNKALSIDWYQKAARQGYSKAQKRLEELGATW